MINLKKLLKEGIEAKYYWLDPEGKLIRVPLQGHANFAINYLRSINNYIEHTNFYRKMYELGWVRATMFGHDGQYHVTFNRGLGKYPSSLQMDILKDLAREAGAFDIRDDSNGKRYNVL